MSILFVDFWFARQFDSILLLTCIVDSFCWVAAVAAAAVADPFHHSVSGIMIDLECWLILLLIFDLQDPMANSPNTNTDYVFLSVFHSNFCRAIPVQKMRMTIIPLPAMIIIYTGCSSCFFVSQLFFFIVYLQRWFIDLLIILLHWLCCWFVASIQFMVIPPPHH